MFKAIKRWWKYLGAALSGKLEEAADPKIQLEQAIREAQDQHRRLTEQAANVIAQQKQTQMRLDRATADLEKINGSARQALLLSDEAAKANDAAKMQQFNQAAEGFANRLVALENEVAGLRTMLLEQARNADNAKAAVQQNSMALQQKLSERQKLLSQLDQAKMQEQMNKAMSQLSASVGDDVPTFAEVQAKIETRLAKAQGMADLTSSSVESGMLEVQQAQMNAEAQSRLSELRTQLGLATPSVEAPAETPAPGGTTATEPPTP